MKRVGKMFVAQGFLSAEALAEGGWSCDHRAAGFRVRGVRLQPDLRTTTAARASPAATARSTSAATRT